MAVMHVPQQRQLAHKFEMVHSHVNPSPYTVIIVPANTHDCHSLQE
jgi:hypothetical protein